MNFSHIWLHKHTTLWTIIGISCPFSNWKDMVDVVEKLSVSLTKMSFRIWGKKFVMQMQNCIHVKEY